MVDLHTHSNVSDGEYSPEEVVDMAKAAGLSALAVSDHDTIEGSRRAMEYGAKIGVRMISAVEISASFEGNVLHILGYYIDVKSEKLASMLKEVCEYREKRAKAMVASVNKELAAEGKTSMDIEAILKLGKEKPITRPDLARHLVELGHVSTHQEAFLRWLTKYNIPNQDLTVESAIRVIHEAHGVAVLAHPFSRHLSLSAITPDTSEQDRILKHFKEAGLDGVEAYRFKYLPQEQDRYITLASSLNLIPTGGTDYHGPHHVEGAPGVGLASVPDNVVEQLLAASAQYK